ncbi:MAG: hypothetical protein IKQ30_11280, partial [Bacteroidales bacterium]|nr:hypothetical protein [Bacteroidales bacterium]
IPHLSDKPKKHVEKLLSIFDQRQVIDKNNPKFVNIDEDKDSSEDYKTLITRLYKATVDEDMRGKIEFEEEMERRFKRERYERAELTDALNEARGMITDQHKQIVEQQNQIAEKDNQLAAKDNVIALSIKAFYSSGQSSEQIAALLNIPISDVETVIKGLK